MVLGHLRNDAKSNEVKAIPELLKQLVLPEGSIVTIDAAGTQKNRAGASNVNFEDPTYPPTLLEFFKPGCEAVSRHLMALKSSLTP